MYNTELMDVVIAYHGMARGSLDPTCGDRFTVSRALLCKGDFVTYTELIIKLMNSQKFSVNSHLLKFVSLCNDLRNNLLSNHADDT